MSKATTLPVSPLAPERFPTLPSLDGMTLVTGSLGLYRGSSRDDLLLVHFPRGASAGGVFTRSLTRSADVDWCREALVAGLRALVKRDAAMLRALVDKEGVTALCLQVCSREVALFLCDHSVPVCLLPGGHG